MESHSELYEGFGGHPFNKWSVHFYDSFYYLFIMGLELFISIISMLSLLYIFHLFFHFLFFFCIYILLNEPHLSEFWFFIIVCEYMCIVLSDPNKELKLGERPLKFEGFATLWALNNSTQIDPARVSKIIYRIYSLYMIYLIFMIHNLSLYILYILGFYILYT